MSIQPLGGITHVITIPGTSYVCKLSLNEAGETDESVSTIRWAKYTTPAVVPPIKVDALLKSLARTTVKGAGKRRSKAQPILQTIEEFQALTTSKAA